MHSPTLAPLRNVAALSETLINLQERELHLPGIGVFYGPAGYGKSFASCYAMNAYNAYYVEARSSWRKKQILEAILIAMSVSPGKAKTVAAMTDLVAENLAISGRSLIVDEFDYVAEKGDVEVIRDIYEASGSAILLVGEEELPTKLQRWERFHSRIMHWSAAEPCDYNDTKELARLYLPEIEVSEDLREEITHVSNGVTRRICVNLNHVKTLANTNGWDSVSLEQWQQSGQTFHNGRAPVRRVRA